MRILTIALVVTMSLCAIALLNRPPVTVRAQGDSADLAALETEMRARLYAAVEESAADGLAVDPARVTIVDYATGWCYTMRGGLSAIPTEESAPPTEGTEEGSQEAGLDSTNCCFPGTGAYGYAPFRRVKSNYWDAVNKKGYALIEGKVTVPLAADFSGVDRTGENAWIYYGLKNHEDGGWPACNYDLCPKPECCFAGACGDYVNYFDFEVGMYSTKDLNKGWKVFSNRAYFETVGDRCYKRTTYTTWDVPPAAQEDPIAPGTPVYMHLKVTSDDTIRFYIEWASGHSWEHYFHGITGAKRDGLGEQKCRRVNSLYVYPEPPGYDGNPDTAAMDCPPGNCPCYGWLRNVKWGVQGTSEPMKIARYCPTPCTNCPGDCTAAYEWCKCTWTSVRVDPIAWNKTWSDPDDKTECADSPNCLDFVTDDDPSLYEYETVSVKAYCNPDQYVSPCNSGSFCGCPWPYVRCDCATPPCPCCTSADHPCGSACGNWTCP
jgi:hypothetical protein